MKTFITSLNDLQIEFHILQVEVISLLQQNFHFYINLTVTATFPFLYLFNCYCKIYTYTNTYKHLHTYLNCIVQQFPNCVPWYPRVTQLVYSDAAKHSNIFTEMTVFMVHHPCVDVIVPGKPQEYKEFSLFGVIQNRSIPRSLHSSRRLFYARLVCILLRKSTLCDE